MEKSKYYTPEIEEFCVGFEYETMYLKSVWTKEVLCQMDCGWFFESYINDAVETEFRVKYLDEQDILDLGFIFFGKNNEHLINDYFRIILHINDKSEVPNVIIHKLRTPTEDVIFKGQIKNKTELIKLLKQIRY